MSLLAHAIAKEEGFGIPNSLPTRNHNPGDLRHSPHSFHLPGKPDAIGKIPTDEEGWADLERQLRLYAERGLTLGQAIYEFAPPTENHTIGYVAYVCKVLGCASTISMEDALKIEHHAG